MGSGSLATVGEYVLPSGIKCGTFGASGIEDRRLAFGDYAGKLHITDLENPTKPIYSVQAHSSIINACAGIGGQQVGFGAPEICTGGRDGCVRVWDPRVKEPVLSLEPEEGQTARDCWTVSFGNSYSDTERCVCAGYDNGDVKLFDLRTNSLRFEANVGNGVTCVEFDRPDIEMNKMAVTTLESKFRVYDLRTQHAESGFASLSEVRGRLSEVTMPHDPQTLLLDSLRSLVASQC